MTEHVARARRTRGKGLRSKKAKARKLHGNPPTRSRRSKVDPR